MDGIDGGHPHDNVSVWVCNSSIARNYANIDEVSFSLDGLQRPGTDRRLEPMMEQVR